MDPGAATDRIQPLALGGEVSSGAYTRAAGEGREARGKGVAGARQAALGNRQATYGRQ
jgi:hypothetical protein